MSIEGKWYFLIGEQPFDPETTTLLELRSGVVRDANLDEVAGTYSIVEGRLRITFPEGGEFRAAFEDDAAVISGNLVDPPLINDNGDDQASEPTYTAATLHRG